jgi:hypothetical protein
VKFKGTFILTSPRHGQALDVWADGQPAVLELVTPSGAYVTTYLDSANLSKLWELEDRARTVEGKVEVKS